MHHGNIDVLSVGHFTFFFILGIFVKDKYKGALLLGILWEIFEIFISHNQTIKNFIVENWVVPEYYWNDTFSHKITDIIFNMIGYHIGNLITPI
tara:strand:- start:186 stop:467 length:282 start_codon:yes stop_codon:yes gene_type:complete